jgi:hypothetical protein
VAPRHFVAEQPSDIITLNRLFSGFGEAPGKPVLLPSRHGWNFNLADPLQKLMENDQLVLPSVTKQKRFGRDRDSDRQTIAGVSTG